MTYLLLDEPPLIVLPTLARLVGLKCAIFLQQVHYWCEHYRRQGSPRHLHDGHWWIYNSRENWCAQFPWWSDSTVKRIISALRARGLLLVANHNRAGYDRTCWYAIDHDRLGRQLRELRRADAERAIRALGQTDPMDQVRLTPSIGSERPNGSVQIDPMDRVKLTQPIPETTHESTHEITQRWAACLKELRGQTTRVTYDTWIARAHLERLDRQEDGSCRATVACEDGYVRDWLQSRLDALIRRALAAALSVDPAQITVAYRLVRGSEGGDE